MPMSYDPNQVQPLGQVPMPTIALFAALALAACDDRAHQEASRVESTQPPSAPAAEPPLAATPGVQLAPRAPSATPHTGCFVRPTGFTGFDAFCFWSQPGAANRDPLYLCFTTEALCRERRSDWVRETGERVSPCNLRVAAMCTDLVGGLANRQCRATRADCETVQQQNEGTPCVRRSTFGPITREQSQQPSPGQ